MRFRVRLRVLSLLAVAGSLAMTLSAQELRPPVADTGIFSAIPWPAANDLRRPDGSPGRGYWQQRASYSIRATLDTAAKKLSGTVAIRILTRMAGDTGVLHRDSLAKNTAAFFAKSRSWRRTSFSRWSRRISSSARKRLLGLHRRHQLLPPAALRHCRVSSAPTSLANR